MNRRTPSETICWFRVSAWIRSLRFIFVLSQNLFASNINNIRSVIWSINACCISRCSSLLPSTFMILLVLSWSLSFFAFLSPLRLRLRLRLRLCLSRRNVEEHSSCQMRWRASRGWRDRSLFKKKRKNERGMSRNFRRQIWSCEILKAQIWSARANASVGRDLHLIKSMKDRNILILIIAIVSWAKSNH